VRLFSIPSRFSKSLKPGLVSCAAFSLNFQNNDSVTAVASKRIRLVADEIIGVKLEWSGRRIICPFATRSLFGCQLTKNSSALRPRPNPCRLSGCFAFSASPATNQPARPTISGCRRSVTSVRSIQPVLFRRTSGRFFRQLAF